MTSKLDYVRKGQTISANAWNELVERVNALERRPSFDFLVPQKQKPTISLALFAITWNWALDANGVAFASASPVDTQTLDVSQDVVTVYAPNGTGDGAAANVEWRWCVWRGRWELCEEPAAPVALLAITWNWALDANGVAFASASPVDTQTLVVSQDVVTVYAPNGTGDGVAANVEWRWCVWRGRWELVEKKPAEPDPTLYSQSVITNLMVNVSNDRLVISNINETIHYYGDEN